MTPPDDEPRLPEDYPRQPDPNQPAQPRQNPYEPTSSYPQPGQPWDQQQPYGQPAGYGQQPPYAPPGYGYGYAGPVTPQHPSATTALVLGIVGLAGIVFCAGITLVLSPFAWAIGRKAVREIDAEPGRYAGRDQAKSGQIMGIIGTVLLALGVIGIVAIIGLAVSATETSFEQSPSNTAPSVSQDD